MTVGSLATTVGNLSTTVENLSTTVGNLSTTVQDLAKEVRANHDTVMKILQSILQRLDRCEDILARNNLK
jgi:outer membrane murein-binding lipoprotein Lpp